MSATDAVLPRSKKLTSWRCYSQVNYIKLTARNVKCSIQMLSS